MGENFKQAIEEASLGVQSPWRILQPPTGSGKTQGACVYATMQAERNLATEGQLKPVGVIIVTRLKEEANLIRDTINAMARRRVALVHHSDDYATADELFDSDVVAITHTAFINAKREQRDLNDRPWDRLVSWRGGQRLLTIIDEALGNVVDESSATLDNLGFVISQIPPEVRSAFPEQVAVLEQVHQVLLSYVDPDNLANSMSVIWDQGTPSSVDFTHFIAAMRGLPYDHVVYAKSSSKRREEVAERVVRTITAIQSCLEQFAYYSKEGVWHSINSAALAIPRDAPGPVVLDATARANFLWDLFGEQCERPSVPVNARDYSSVRLHVARASGLGKNAMVDHIKHRLPRIRRAVEAAVGSERSVFCCVHKAVEEVVKRTWVTDKEGRKLHGFERLEIGHWGAVDGRNTWQDFDTALILGLPYRPQTWATNTFCALQGAQDDRWLKSPEWKQFKNVRKVMEQRQLSVSIIQAINRIRCRHVIDAEGHCPTADIFIVLPEDNTGDAILDDIKADMPGLDVRQWDFRLDPVRDKKPRIGSSHARVIDYMEKQPAGAVSLSDIQHDLRLTSVKKLREALNNADHPATKALANLGVKYVAGVGRGSKSFLMKAA